MIDEMALRGTVSTPAPGRRAVLGIVAAVCGLLGATQPAAAEGDPTRRATRLDPLVLDAATGFSITSYEIETGTYYRWRIRSDGLEEYMLVAPGLFRNSWIDQVVIEDKEVKPFGLQAVEFDDEGEIDVWFVPIRPGTYEFWVEGLKTQGFSGEFVVR
jgi:hypothetical protein